MSEFRYAYDLYPRDDPRDGARILRFSDLTEGEWVAEANGTGSGVIILPGDSPDAGSIDPRGLQYVRVVEIDPDDPDGATLSGFAERVVHGFFLDTGSFDALTEQNTKRLTFGGAGTLSYWARAVMAPHTYIHDVFTGQDPFDRTWRLDQQSTVYANGNYTGAMLWRVLYELSHFRSGATYTHKHADGIIYTDAHDDDRTESAVPDAVIDFTAFLDSNGNAWTEKVGEFRVSVLDNGLSVIRLLMELGAYVEMDPDTFETRAYQASSHRRDRTGGAWGSSVIRFQSPTDGTLDTGNILSDAKRALTAHIQRSTMWAGGGDDVYAKATGTFDIPWEGGLNSDANDLDALEVQADRQITARSDAGDTLRVRTVPIDDPAGGFYRPLHSTGILLDDLATVHNGAGQWDFDEQTFPVAGVGGKLREGGDWDTFVDLGASFRPMEGRQFQVAPLGSHTHPPNPRLCRDSGVVWQQTTSGDPLTIGFAGSVLTVSKPEGPTGSVTRWADVSPGGQSLPIERLWRVLMHWDEDVDNWSVGLGMDGQPDPPGSTDWAYLTFGVVGGFFTAALETSEFGSGASHSFGGAGGDDQHHEFFVRVRLESGAFRARIWDVADAEPGPWTVEDAVTDFSPLSGALESLGVSVSGVANDGTSTNNFEVELIEPEVVITCIHGGPDANSGDAAEACGKCVAPGNHEHDYVAAGGTLGQVLKKASADDWDTEWEDESGGSPTDATYLVTAAHADLSAEVVVGATPGGELGGTWASPTVDATHSGSAHHTESHQARHANGGADEVAVEGLPTAETDTALVLHPDGTGGIEWGTDEGGGSGIAGELITDTIIGDGAEDTFALSETPTGSWALVSTNGADLLPSEYAIVVGDIVFDVAPVNLAEVLVTFITGGFTTPATDPSDIVDPTLATAEDVALKLNALMANLRTAGIIA